MGWPSFVNDVWKWMISIVVDFGVWFNGVQGSGFNGDGAPSPSHQSLVCRKLADVDGFGFFFFAESRV